MLTAHGHLYGMGDGRSELHFNWQAQPMRIVEKDSFMQAVWCQ